MYEVQRGASGALPAGQPAGRYKDNGMLHCALFTTVFLGCSSLGLGYFDLGMMYDNFIPMIKLLNVFGLLFCVLLTIKGLKSRKHHGA